MKRMYKGILCSLAFAMALLPCSAALAAGEWTQTAEGKLQYLEDGAPASGWKKVGSWYYFDQNGTPVTGWKKSSGKWYYLDPETGAMRIGWLNENGKDYFTNKSGVMQKGWTKVGSNWYYFNKSGTMYTGWKQSGGKWYYLQESGKMAKGWKQVSGQWYYFYSSGAMAANTTVNGYKINKSGVWVASAASNEKEYPAKGKYTAPGSVYGVRLTQSELNQVKTKVKQIVKANIKSGMSDYDKALKLFEYLVINCNNADDWSKNKANTAWGALIYGEAQCSGYARAYKALLDEVGIYCHYVHATNNDHQWNMIKLDGKWYIVDPQPGIFLATSNEYRTIYGMRWDTSKYPEATTIHPSRKK